MNGYHPDRDGCDCEKRGLMEEEECVHPDPCWVSREAYERSLSPTQATAEQSHSELALEVERLTAVCVRLQDALRDLVYEVELDAARESTAAGLGASEWEAFMRPELWGGLNRATAALRVFEEDAPETESSEAQPPAARGGT